MPSSHTTTDTFVAFHVPQQVVRVQSNDFVVTPPGCGNTRGSRGPSQPLAEHEKDLQRTSWQPKDTSEDYNDNLSKEKDAEKERQILKKK